MTEIQKVDVVGMDVLIVGFWAVYGDFTLLLF